MLIDNKNVLIKSDFIVENALYIVPTPIGNLDDMTIRAINVLSNVDVIAAEDTRTAGILLQKFGIKHKQLISYFEHNEINRIEQIIQLIKTSKSVALISEAGTPTISDPGYKLIRELSKEGIKIIPLPGASAFLTALTASGLPTDRFTFVGFPPAKKGRKTFLKNISEIEHTVILYESPYKILKLIDELIEICGEEREVCLSREITKIYEEHLRGKLFDIKNALENKSSIKGEFVLILQGKN